MTYQYNPAKENLARLLASENINVVRSNCETASFDLSNRTLNMPIWDVEESVYDLLTLHEVSHALNTPAEGWHTALKSLKAPASYYNIIEDARIERLIKNKFGGAGRIMSTGYKSLHDSNFLGLAGHDINKMSLIDRINIYYKLGAHMWIPFEDSEREWLVKIDAAKTWQDCVEIAEAIFNSRVNENASTDKSPKTGPGEQGADGESVQLSDENGDPMEADPSDSSSAVSDSQPNYDDMDDSVTDSNLRQAMEQMERQSAGQNANTHYVTLGDFDSSQYIVPVSKLRDYISPVVNAARNASIGSYYDNHALQPKLYESCEKLKNDNKSIISNMVKEFEARKSAESVARAAISKTGRLDPKKLHQYKTNDDIFRRTMTLHKGKSHGMVMLLDWSGSIHRNLPAMVEQVIILATTNRRLGVPFSVQMFSDTPTLGSSLDCRPPQAPTGTQNVEVDFCLVEMLNSNTTLAEFNQDILNLYALSMYASGGSCWYYDIPKPLQDRIFHFRLNGTPLTPALLMMADYLPKFSEATRCQITNLIILTDGESSRDLSEFNREKTVVYDKKSGLTQRYSRWERYNGMPGCGAGAGALINLVRARAKNDTRVHYYYIGDRSVLRHYGSASELKNGFVIRRKKDLPKEFCPDSYTLIASNKLEINARTWDLNGDNEMSTRKITQSFNKFMGEKKTSRKLTSDFIDMIA